MMILFAVFIFFLYFKYLFYFFFLCFPGFLFKQELARDFPGYADRLLQLNKHIDPHCQIKL